MLLSLKRFCMRCYVVLSNVVDFLLFRTTAGWPSNNSTVVMKCNNAGYVKIYSNSSISRVCNGKKECLTKYRAC